MACTDDIAVLDFQVRFGIRDGARSKHQIPVELVGVGAGGRGLDQRVAHPCGMRALAAQCALVHDAGLAFGVVVNDHRPMLDMLARVGEIDAEHVEIALGAAEILVHADTHNVTAERHHGMPQRGSRPDTDAVVAHMFGAFIPFLHEGRGDMRIRARGDFHAFSDTGETVMFDDDIAMRTILRDDDQMNRIKVIAAAVDMHEHRRVDFAAQAYYGSRLAAGPFDRGNPVVRHHHGS